MTSPDSNRLLRRVDRERRARIEAEKLLEEKSLSLYEANRRLAQSHYEQKGTAEELKAILDNFPRGILIVDADGIVETINFHAVQMFGTTNKMATGRNINMLLPHISDITDPSQVEAAIDAGDLRIEGLRADQGKFPVELAFTAIGEGESKRIIWMVRDISDRVAAEKERQKLS